MLEQNILSKLLLSPMLGVVVIIFTLFYNGERGEKIAKFIAVLSSLTSLLITYKIYNLYNFSIKGFQLEDKSFFFNSFYNSYHLGIDGISFPLIILTNILFLLSVVYSCISVSKRIKQFLLMLLVSQFLIIGSFCSLNFFMFYVLFEAILIPIYFVIAVWGGENKEYASFKFFIFTLAGSVFLLISMIYIHNQAGTFNIPELLTIVPKFELKVQIFLWLGMFFSFAVKIPMVPFHTWLPDAHVQAPTTGSMILAGILLKLGGYGFLRFSLPLLPLASEYFTGMIFILSAIAIVYAALIAFAQSDLKKMIAYSSISHMGFVTMAIFANNIVSVTGAVMQMLSHGIVSAALFLCVGIIYEKTGSKNIKNLGGVASRMPVFAFLMLIFTMSSIGLPATFGFISEFLAIIGVFGASKIFAIIASLSIILGASYMLLMYKKVMFGNITNSEIANINDINIIEQLILLVLAVITILVGVYPQLMIQIIDHTAAEMILSNLVR